MVCARSCEICDQKSDDFWGLGMVLKGNGVILCTNCDTAMRMPIGILQRIINLKVGQEEFRH